MFEAGSEPSGRKRVNNYFNLRWIDIIKSALEEEDLEMLNESQFRRVLQMGSHTFSVMFLHYCLSRQLVTAKEYELWWIFVGKPIRYAIQDFAMVTGLNCGHGVGLTGEPPEKGIGRGKASGKGKSSMSIWDDLYRGKEKPTPGWIMERLVRANPSGAPHGGESFHVDVETLLRRAADAYEEKVIAMYEGYILSLKGHFNSEVGGLRTDLQAATSAIAHLETKVTGEFDKINQLLKSRLRGADMGPTYGFSPERHSSPFPGQNDDFNNSEVNPDRPTTHTGAPDGMGTHTKFVVSLNTMKLFLYSMPFHNLTRLFHIILLVYIFPQSTPRQGEDVAATETASVGLRQNLDEGERGGGLSPGKQTDSTDGAEFRVETGGEHGGDADIGHDPINVEVGEHGGDADIGHDPINVEVCPLNFVVFYTILCS
ncbi:BnaA09g27020D [Brassica napus]|uniref:BnaA09g27020D protein n=1 Tax=Brassica napus TaxID=3708 RepID=A0A078H8F5_BRANA|nr:BnaA09g27020D [Brassica napus]